MTRTGRPRAARRSDRAIAAYDGDRIVGTAGAFSFELTVPAGPAAAGVTLVESSPRTAAGDPAADDARAARQVRERGEPGDPVGLEGVITSASGKAGTMRMGIAVERIARVRSSTRPRTHSLRRRGRGEEPLPAIHDALRPGGGFFNRTPARTPSSSTTRSPGVVAPSGVVRRGTRTDGHADGYARSLREGGTTRVPSCGDAQRADGDEPGRAPRPVAIPEDIDLMAKLRRGNSLTTRPAQRLGAARAGGQTWATRVARVVDLSAALRGRTYRSEGSVVLR